MNPEVERAVEKKRVIKEDGRYLIFYAFERPLPQVGPEKAKESSTIAAAKANRAGKRRRE